MKVKKKTEKCCTFLNNFFCHIMLTVILYSLSLSLSSFRYQKTGNLCIAYMSEFKITLCLCVPNANKR